MSPHTYPAGCFFKTISDIQKKRVTIMGLGLNGGGLATARFFLQHGARVTVTDMKTRDGLLESVTQLEGDKTFDHSLLTFRLGAHDIADFENADCVIKNPGVKFEGNRFLEAAVKNGVAIETDLSVFLHFCSSPIIAVTGSKGKSSTVSAIYHALCECGFTAFLGGNITVSPLTFLEQTNESTPVVLELSSWQLADLRGRKLLKPRVSVITKIVPDHLNWYGNMSDYVADKKLIYADQNENDFAIFDFSAWQSEDASVKNCAAVLQNDFAPPNCTRSWGEIFASETKARVVHPEKMNITLPKLQVPGAHNKTNALNTVSVLCLLGVEKEKACKAIASWQGIAHRLQYFHSWQNSNALSDVSQNGNDCATSKTNEQDALQTNCAIRFYNDSAATVPEAAIAAISSFDEPLILITGGTDKGLDMKMLAKAIKNAPHIARLHLLSGTATDKLVSHLDEMGVPHEKPFDNLHDLLTSLRNAEIENPSGAHIVLFSPGATSFGMFQNEFDRGNKFMQAVKAIF